MANITIKESRVLNLREFTGTDGRAWKGAELLWQGDEGAAFSPGQFLMAARKSKSFPWATPLTIQKKSGEGFWVCLHPNSPLWEVSAHEALTLWGPCGTGLALERDFFAVSDAAGSLFIRPFAEQKQCKGWYILGQVQDSPLFTGQEIQKIKAMEEVWEMALAKDTVTEFLVALPMNLARKWKENAPAAIGLRTRIFTGVKVGCGIGACRGCYIDSSALPQGIPVCQEGPFLPAMSIDYEKDQKFLAHYL